MVSSVAPNGVTSSQADPLLDCLRHIARLHGTQLTPDALRAGLPLPDGRLTPSLFERAASRAHLAARLVKTPIHRLERALLPAVLLLKDETACVLVSLDLRGDSVEVIFPELGESVVTLSLVEIEERYSGSLFYVRPHHRFDARTPEIRKKRTAHWFWGVISENRALYRDVMLAAFMVNLFALAMPLFTMNVYDRVVPNRALETLAVLAVGVAVILLADLLLRGMRSYFVDLAATRADITLSSRIMEQVLGTPMALRPASVGSFASNLRAFESVRDFTGSATILAFIDLPFAAIFLVVIGYIAWPLLIPLGIGVVVMLLYTFAVQARMHALSETSLRAGAQRNATLVEGLNGLETLKVLNAESAIQRRWEDSASVLARTSSQLKLLQSSASQGAAWTQQTAGLALMVLGVWLIANNQMSMGALIACYMLSSRAMAPLGQVAALLVQYHTASTALESLDKLMHQPVERPAGRTFVHRPTLQGAIEFREVSFTYPNQQQPALRKLSLKIEPGEHVALLGRVGSGKTTLAKLILGLYQPQEGQVLLDGIDLEQLDPAEVRRNMGHVAQDIMLFYGSLRDNLTLADPHIDDAQLLESLRAAGILPFVSSHPQGLDMIVGERGDTLSGGQRQAVGLARAIVHQPAIMLLDEPTASMDQGTEAEVKKALTELSAGRTALVVTHRTALLTMVDRIVVLDRGQIVADGPKEQVLEALRSGRISRAGA